MCLFTRYLSLCTLTVWMGWGVRDQPFGCFSLELMLYTSCLGLWTPGTLQGMSSTLVAFLKWLLESQLSQLKQGNFFKFNTESVLLYCHIAVFLPKA